MKSGNGCFYPLPLWLFLSVAEWSFQSVANIYSVLEVVFDGEYSMFDAYEAPIMLSAPSGDFDVIATANVGCKYTTMLGPSLVNAFIDFAGINSTKRGFDLQVSLGASISYSLILM